MAAHLQQDHVDGHEEQQVGEGNNLDGDLGNNNNQDEAQVEEIIENQQGRLILLGNAQQLEAVPPPDVQELQQQIVLLQQQLALARQQAPALARQQQAVVNQQQQPIGNQQQQQQVANQQQQQQVANQQQQQQVANQQQRARINLGPVGGPGQRRANTDVTAKHLLAFELANFPDETKVYLREQFDSGASVKAILEAAGQELPQHAHDITEAWLNGQFHLTDIDKEFKDNRKRRIDSLNVSAATGRLVSALENDDEYPLPVLMSGIYSRIEKMTVVITEGASKDAGVGSDKLTQQRTQQEAALMTLCYVVVGTDSVGLVMCPITASFLKLVRDTASSSSRTKALHRAIAGWNGVSGVHQLYRQAGILIVGLLVRFEAKCDLLTKNFEISIKHILDPDILSIPGSLKSIDGSFGFAARELIGICLAVVRLHRDHANDKEGYSHSFARLAHEIEVVHNYIDRLLFEEPGNQAFIAMTAVFNETGAEQASAARGDFLLKTSPTSSLNPKYDDMLLWAEVGGDLDVGDYAVNRSKFEELVKKLSPTIFVQTNETLLSSKVKQVAAGSTPSQTSSQQQQPSNVQLSHLTSVIAGLDKTLKNTTAFTNTGATSGVSSNRTSVSTATSTNVGAAPMMAQRRDRTADFYCKNHPHANTHNTEDCHRGKGN